jgi:PIN domain nuclease of toxin-antitoxin system
MTFLLDTHVFLWLLGRPERIRPDLLSQLRAGETTLILSAASSWEIAIKWAVGRLRLPLPPAEYVPDRMRRLGVIGLAVSHAHTLRTSTLPPHHRDPFDRLLVAQALADDLTIVTVDRAFDAYDVPTIDAAAVPRD